MTTTRYDSIGLVYAAHRRPDPRIAAQIGTALGDAERMVNVGAGAGSYEPHDCVVVAVEPSAVMIAQRPETAATVVRAVAEALPFPDDTFDAALAILTIHHWSDRARGLAELRRVARRCVVLCFDPNIEHQFWAIGEYWPEIAELDRESAPPPADVADALGTDRVETIPIPWDCTDGFLGAYWRRPAAYLDESVRACISGFARLEPAVVDRGVDRLNADIRDGTWMRNHADLLEQDTIDLGYRLVVSG